MLLLTQVNTFSQETFVNRIIAPFSFRSGNLVRASNRDYFASVKVGDASSSNGFDIYCTRMNKNGKILWEKTFGTPNVSETTTKLLASSDNGAVIFAKVQNTISKEYAAVIIKCDSLGNIQWSKKLISKTGFFNIRPAQVIEDPQGNYVLLYDLIPKDYWNEVRIQIVKFDSSGNLIYHTGFKNVYDPGESQYFTSTSITQKSNGEFLISLEYDCSICQNGSVSYLIWMNQNDELITYKKADI